MSNRTSELLNKLKVETTELLAENLVGIYLHGSYALGSYNEQVSDLDYVIVIKRPLSFTAKQALMTKTITDLWPLSPAKGLEFHVLLLADTQHFKQPLPFDFHFSKMHYSDYMANPNHYIEAMTGTDPDLAAHLTILTKAGKVLVGPPIATVFSPVPVADYWNSLMFDVADAPQTIVEHPMYTILNLCRVLAYHREKLILSKAGGGQWGLTRLPSRYHALIEAALAAYRDNATQDLSQYSEEDLTEFATWLLMEIKRELVN
ncbi:aminoglycoside adenylyltransferase domain-containing protein [Lactiplantibacillus nangangensis]|uniref:Spectinomycin 9-adenylyltransferase n=1 Tax=Lactiplantibacillus nangangensis TaxID=2559917 RepID=A0ABW1SJ45_9LACO|nr:aminoglycoside adenylyltransferase domain-containing protein [Lactiplantibacillus nangangensis]